MIIRVHNIVVALLALLRMLVHSKRWGILPTPVPPPAGQWIPSDADIDDLLS